MPNGPASKLSASNGKTWCGHSRRTSPSSQNQKAPTLGSAFDGLTTKKT
jgi:hypothetical protein